MIIREIKNGDAQQILKLVTSILAQEFPEDQSAYPAGDLKNIAEIYSGPNSVFLVAEQNKRIVGTCGVKADGSEAAILRRLFVDQEFRGQGIGYGLLSKALQFCKDRGFREVVIRTSTQMEQATRLCRSFGFTENGRWPMGQVTLIIYRLRLA